MIDQIIERFSIEAKSYGGTNLHKLRQILSEIATDEILKSTRGNILKASSMCGVSDKSFRMICPTLGQYRPIKEVRKVKKRRSWDK